MDKKEAVKEALSHCETSPIPYFLNFTPPLAKRLEEHFCTKDLSRFLGNYIIWPQVVPTIPDNLNGDSYIDCFGVHWANVGSTRGYVVKHPLEEIGLEDYHFPEPCPETRLDWLRQLSLQNRDLFIVVKLGDLYERANFLRGMQNLMIDMYRKPDFVEKLFERLTEYNLQVIERLGQLNIDGLSLSDDYGWQRGLLISPKLWRRFIKPHLKKVFDKIREEGLYSFLHSDGNIIEIMPDLVEVGIDALHPVQSEVMNLSWLKKKFGKELTFFGGFSTQTILPRSKPEEIRREVKKTISLMGRNGGFIIAPGIGMHEDVPLENALAFIDAVIGNRGLV